MFFQQTSTRNSTQLLDSLKHHCSAFHPDMEFSELREHVQEAEERFILPVLGQDVYDELQTHYESFLNGAALGAEEGAIIRRFQPAVAYYAYYLAMAARLVSVSTTGTGEIASSDGTHIPARLTAFYASRKHYWETANRKLDRWLKWLASPANAYADWQNSAEFAAFRSRYFATPAELSNHLSTNIPYAIWIEIGPSVRRAEERYIQPILGSDFDAELKAALRTAATDAASPLSEAQARIISLIRDALAQWVMKFALPHLRLELEHGLIKIQEEIQDAFKGRNLPASETGFLWQDLDGAAWEGLAALKSYLFQNPDTYPTWRDSGLYDAEKPPQPPTNDPSQFGPINLL